MSATERIVRLIIQGRVQGVGFRVFVADEAQERGLKGWVRNRRDGAVEAFITGRSDLVDEVIAACRCGPPGGRVDKVAVEEAGDSENAQTNRTFLVLPTI